MTCLESNILRCEISFDGMFGREGMMMNDIGSNGGDGDGLLALCIGIGYRFIICRQFQRKNNCLVFRIVVSLDSRNRGRFGE